MLYMFDITCAWKQNVSPQEFQGHVQRLLVDFSLREWKIEDRKAEFSFLKLYFLLGR